MITRKPLSELNLSDNYLFANTMSNEGICKEFLEKLLHIEIADENFCKENREIALQDDAKKVILSTKGTMDDVSDEMRDFLKYVESSTADMATVSNGSLTRHIHDVVEKVKIERRVDYMTLPARSNNCKNISEFPYKWLENGFLMHF